VTVTSTVATLKFPRETGRRPRHKDTSVTVTRSGKKLLRSKFRSRGRKTETGTIVTDAVTGLVIFVPASGTLISLVFSALRMFTTFSILNYHHIKPPLRALFGTLKKSSRVEQSALTIEKAKTLCSICSIRGTSTKRVHFTMEKRQIMFALYDIFFFL
jgi:hypothetical protein